MDARRRPIGQVNPANLERQQAIGESELKTRFSTALDKQRTAHHSSVDRERVRQGNERSGWRRLLPKTSLFVLVRESLANN